MTEPLNLDDATQNFQSSHSNILGPALPSVGSSGILNVQSFQRSHNVVAGLLDHFVTMACTLLYYSTILQTWPNSEALDAFSVTAINLIITAHSIHGVEVAEHRKFSNLIFIWINSHILIVTSHVISLIAKWVSSQVRYHLEEVLDIARTFMFGFNLSDDNNCATNQFNFRLATQLSAYLHLHNTENDHRHVSLHYAVLNWLT